MDKKSKLWLFLLVVSAVFWLGGINVRFIIGNELLIFDEFNFRTAVPPDEENVIFRLLFYSSISVFVSYIITLISAIMFLKTCKLKLKENAWLIICSTLFFIFVPVELYSFLLDYKFGMLFLQKPPSHDELLKIFGRFSKDVTVSIFTASPAIPVLSIDFMVSTKFLKP